MNYRVTGSRREIEVALSGSKDKKIIIPIKELNNNPKMKTVYDIKSEILKRTKETFQDEGALLNYNSTAITSIERIQLYHSLR